MIPFNRASFLGDEEQFFAEALSRGHISGNGIFTKQAEQRLTELVGGQKSLLTTSCTHALELSARLLNLQLGDEVIVPSYTFVSSAAAFAINGATPVFVDVRDDTLNLDFEQARAAITSRTKAICVVHYAGIGAEPDAFAKLASEQGIALIEDNAHGLGGSWQGKPLGSFGMCSTMSFHETKNVTCGEGGAIALQSQELLERAEILREKGTNRSRFLRGQVDKYTWVDVGSSWVMSDLLAAVLTAQLEQFDEIQASRMRVWIRYDHELSTWANANGVRTPHVPQHAMHTAHMYFLRLPSLEIRTAFIKHLERRGVVAVFHYQALHLSPIGQSKGRAIGPLPVSEAAADTLVRLPLYRSISDEEVERVLEAVTSFAV
jgi:dTDP-4-amino-4,6-dideoxygalactose transaminase